VGGQGELEYAWSGSGTGDTTKLNDTTLEFNGALAGDYSFVFSIEDEAGCQASDTFIITVYPPTYSFDELEVCAETPSFPWNHRTIVSDRDSMYVDTLVGANQYGCDSILTLDVKVLFPELYDTTLYVCENETPFQPYGNITVLPGRDSVYFDTVRYVDSGCDSLLVTINVFTVPVSYADFDTTLCAGADEFRWNNRWIQTAFSEIYLDTLENSLGCDSLLTYNVSILPPDTVVVDTTLCQDAPAFE